MKILEILFLIVPVTAWALWNDRNGDDHKTSNDIIWECVIMFLCSEVIAYIEGFHIAFKAMLVSITGFGLIFPYLFNWHWWNKNRMGDWMIHQLYAGAKKEYILTHLSKTALPDRWFLKYNISWQVRLIGYLVLFTASVIWFII